jgi:DNA mismatch repair ATPase MutL
MSGETEMATRSKEEQNTTRVVYSISGEIKSKKVENGGDVGTTVTVSRLFEHQPVRREHAHEQGKKIKDMLIEYSLIRTDICFKFHDNPKPPLDFHSQTAEVM